VTRQSALIFLAALLASAALAKPVVSKKFPGHEELPPVPRAAPKMAAARRIFAAKKVDVLRPTPRPVIRAAEAPEPVMDLSHALPGKALAKLPSSAEQLQTLSSELKQGTPQLAGAKQKSDALAAEAATLRRKLIETAARIETLERQKIDAAAQIETLQAENTRLSAGFANDRVAVTRLIGVLERLQHDMPPALAMRPDDALGAARGAMLIGASLPPVYAQAAALSRRIDALRRTRAALEEQRRTATETSARLTVARAELDILLEQKEREAAGAAETYTGLRTQLATVARQTADFQALLARVKALRQDKGAADQSVVTVTAENSGALGGWPRTPCWNRWWEPWLRPRKAAIRAFPMQPRAGPR
jgi:septal ring factor EnvC (AmiA/AmiB activator)